MWHFSSDFRCVVLRVTSVDIIHLIVGIVERLPCEVGSGVLQSASWRRGRKHASRTSHLTYARASFKLALYIILQRLLRTSISHLFPRTYPYNSLRACYSRYALPVKYQSI